MDVRTWMLLGSVFACACSFDGSPIGDGSGTLGSTGDSAPGETTAPSSTAPTATASATTAGMTSSPTEPATTAATEPPPTDSDADLTSTGEPPEASGCPSPLPNEWIACRDFESGLDGFAAVTGDGLKPSEDGFESDGALIFQHTPGDNWIGAAILRFGEGPAADNIESSDRRFDEVWLRIRTRTSEDWTAYGHGNLVQLEARVEGGQWPRAHAIALDSNIGAGVLSATSYSCIFGDTLAGCSGEGNDWSIMQARGGAVGQAAYATPDDAGEWHCVTMHARLNTPGSVDGVLELGLDGVEQVSDHNVDYRGNWDEVGFNTLTLPTWWPNPGPPGEMARLVDDLVLSSQPLSCD